MIPTEDEVARFARQELASAQDIWADEILRARRSLRCCDLLASAQRSREAFLRFMDAYGYLRVRREHLSGGTAASMIREMRRTEREVDLGITDISFVAVSRSMDLLRADTSRRDTSDVMYNSAKPYRQLACEFARSV